jgi:chromosome segregation protein
LYLKSLKLVGFKSFADRTRLEFEPGVSVMVGPNGSGKSNIVDAIAWVMGTQSTRSLRTEKMEDVIFAGTAARPALGKAEVQLVFDNADRSLPLDLDEVAITRRLFRDGTSEYAINGMDCRLLDVQELLSDSGVGRTQHVIVGQGQLDSVLNAKPEQHREVIEEAAGILKHRMRKDRAIRRLERTDADVLRLHDIVRELTRQMRPLKRQAEAADRHDDVKAALRASRLYLGGEELRQTRTRLSNAAREEMELGSQVDRSRAELETLVDTLERLASEAGQAGRDLDRDTAAAARLETTGERLQRIAQVAHERSRALRSRIQGAGERRRDLEDEARKLEVELAQSGDLERRAQHEVELREHASRSLEDQERTLSEQESMPAEGALAMTRGNLRSLDAEAARDEREQDDIDRRAEAIRTRRESEESEVDRLKQEIRETDELTAAAQQVYEAAKAAREQDQARWEESEKFVRRCEVALAAGTARLEALEAAGAGGDPAARAHAESLDAVRGPLTAALDVPEALASAVDAALSIWAESLIVDRADLLEGVVRELKSGGFGRIPLVPSMPEPMAPAARGVAETFGVDAIIDRLGPAADRGLAGVLLGDVVVVEDWSSGWSIVQRHPGIRAVTPDGDLITIRGIRLADPDGAGPAALDAARHAAEAAQVDLARAQTVERANHRAFDDARASERAALEDLEALETKLGGSADALDRLDRSVASGAEELERLVARTQVLAQAAERRDGQRRELAVRLTALEGEEAERQAAWEELNRQRETLALQRDAARRARAEASEALGGIVERRRMLEQRLRSVRGELQQMTDRPVDPAEVERLAETEEQARATLEVVKAKIDELRIRQRHLREVAGEAGTRLAAARKREGELRTSIELAREQANALAIELTELRIRDDAVAEGLRRDADATEEEALAAPEPELAEDEDLVARVERLEAELRRMGPINPLAAAEYRELEERHTHITDQLADLEASRDELRKVIHALDDEIEQLFMSALDEVARNYEEFFGVLFPGGRGRIKLSDPNKPLQTGLEIAAQPHGKRVSRLSLLSGGERSLAALAFLFAVFKARPSPFYIMDEVEAALDDANLRRFLRLVERFRGSAQLLVVTHQQQTMEGADVLYGVTMEPGGSSKALAKRMEELKLDV